MTVADLLTAALKRINVIQAGEVPTADDQADAFLRLNDLMDAWQTERLTIPFSLATTFTIVSGTRDYTVGTGGTVNVLRPTGLTAVHFLDNTFTPAVERNLPVLSDAAWYAIPFKTLTNTLPTYAYYNPTYAAGLGTLSLWMVPTSSSLQGVVYAPSAVPTFTSVTDTILLPPGYRRFIRDNLAVELAPEWGAQVSPALVQSAVESKAAIKVINVRQMDCSTPDVAALFGGLTGATTIYTGP